MIDLNAAREISFYGAGKSNAALRALLVRLGYCKTVTLRTDSPVSREVLDAFNPDVLLCGTLAKKHFTEDILFLSPSVKRERILPPPKTRVATDVELFFENKPRRAIGVTGSDGKSTTTYLISEMLKRSGYDAHPLGNYGTPLSDFFESDCYPVCELSSFQLSHYTPRLSCAVITNVTENHLDWHGSMEEYVRVKLSVLDKADSFVYDADSDVLFERLRGMCAGGTVSMKHSYEELRSLARAELYVTYNGYEVLLNGKPYVNIRDAKRRERYNLKNYALAIAATQGLATKEAVLQTILSFNGLNHRSELILSEDGINYIDSSADSSPERSARTLGEISGRAAAIVGGRGKGLSHGPLCDALLKKCIGAVAIGETADEIIEYMRRDKKYAGFNIVRAGGMHEAVRLARNMLGGEGTLILSPAATSFDTYKNFEERALDFKSACIALSKKEL